ncbi:cysteine--tRNA ligase [Patescibacteria group bacterium]|nr:cysteine--tRNA ligase [Patescibacteria group bacterium]
MPVYLTNTLTRSKEVFTPIQNGYVKIYSCGPTVYDFVHIGNLRSYVFSDILKRMLLLNGYEVEHTINLTDFGHLSDDGDHGEDKMMIALKRDGKKPSLEAMKPIADRYSEAFMADMEALGNATPNHYARASEYIVEEIALVKMLDEKGYTYETRDGVYFDISRFPAYGKLGNINLQALKDGARVEANPDKRHPADFAVWKKGELGWDSPWGKGFPGWHIECTAMIFATLGKQIDIHTGGIDHIATHHNGEIAQAEAATSKTPYVRYWMHHAFITIDNTKISKSLSNGIQLNHLVERGYHPLDYRYWLLTGHYSSPMNFTFEALDGARNAHFKLKRFIYEDLAGKKGGKINAAYTQRFIEFLNDDLNTPGAIALLWEIVKDKNLTPEDKRATLLSFDETLVLGLSDIHKGDIARTLGVVEIESLPDEVKELIALREAARTEKRWADADVLRQQINLLGYVVEDGANGAKVTKQ